MLIQSQRTKRESSKVAGDSWIANHPEDTEPLIDNFDYAAFLDRHYERIEPGVHRIAYTYNELKTIGVTAITKLKAEPTLVEVRAPIIVVGGK